MDYTHFDDKWAKTSRKINADWVDIVNLMKAPTAYPTKADCPLIKFATFGERFSKNGSLRHDGNILSVTGIECDYDGEKMPINDACESLALWGIRAVLYTSASHTPEKPRWRVLLPLSRPRAPSDRAGFTDVVNEVLGGVLAPESFALSQAYFYGRVEGAEYVALESSGQCIDDLGFILSPKRAAPVPDEQLADLRPAVTDEQLADLGSALRHLASKGHGDKYPEWVSIGQALKAASRAGRVTEIQSLWLEYSSACEGFEGDGIALRKWAQLQGGKTGIGAIFNRAQELGWINPRKGQVTMPNGSRYKLLNGADLAGLPPLQWRIRGVLPAVGLAGLYGPSASGKSFLALDMAAAIAEGSRWFGCRVESAPVVYAALEGEGGFRLRVDAWKAQHECDLPAALRMVLQSFKLTEPQDVADLAAVLPPGAVVFLDTLNRAAPTADENSSKDMGEILEAAKLLQALAGGLVVLVHHTGKDATKGARGHSSLFAALDAAVEVSRDGDRRTWKVAKSKDGQDGRAHPFRLVVIPLGVDDYGDPVDSCVIASDTTPAAKFTDRLSDSAQLAIDALRREVAEKGMPAPDAIKNSVSDFDGTLRVVSVAAWKQACSDAGISKRETSPSGKQKAFNRAKACLLERGYVVASDNYVWLQ